MERHSPLDLIRRALVARFPVVALVSPEEERVERVLCEVAASTFSKPAPVHVWTAAKGLEGPAGPLPDSRDPLAALDLVASSKDMGIFLFHDLHVHFDDPLLVRRLKDLRRELSGSFRFLFFLGAAVTLPAILKRDVALFDVPLPSPAELAELVDARAAKHPKPLAITDEQRRQAVIALQGLTENEAMHALNLSLFGREQVDKSVLASLYGQKEQLARKEGVLEFVAQRWGINDIGGLDNLKSWLLKRKKLFEDPSPEAASLTPRGVLMMGVSGCGKSLSVKAISSLWNLPLFRLEMGQVFSSVHGTPEEAFDRALKMMDAVAPAILWIDEIENGISAQSIGSDAGIKGRIFATFLTWMQEKSPKIFVAATANRIDLLPAELLRKGRFDQVFFLDLPNEDERAQIFAVHLHRRGADPKRFDLTVLAKSTKNWNGAEIEQCVVAAMVEAYDKKKPVDEDELFVQIGKIVPLATTMAEQVKHIKSWAHDRAIKAS